jgi:hypothetical protein
MDGKLTPEELVEYRGWFGNRDPDIPAGEECVCSKCRGIRLLAHIAALDAELAAEVNARHALEDTMEQFAERVSKAEADKQIVVEALNTINRLPESTMGYLMAETARQALSRIEEG